VLVPRDQTRGCNPDVDPVTRRATQDGSRENKMFHVEHSRPRSRSDALTRIRKGPVLRGPARISCNPSGFRVSQRKRKTRTTVDAIASEPVVRSPLSRDRNVSRPRLRTNSKHLDQERTHALRHCRGEAPSGRALLQATARRGASRPGRFAVRDRCASGCDVAAALPEDKDRLLDSDTLASPLCVRPSPFLHRGLVRRPVQRDRDRR
jgi:hypothetical protein